MSKEAIMTRMLLALALVLFPRAADAAVLRTSLPCHVPAPHVTTSPARERSGPLVPAARRPEAGRSPRALHAPSGGPRPITRWTIAPQLIHVHDGDTFYVGVDTIRLRGIDTPELGQPRAYEARRRLIELLHAGTVTIVRRAEDVYGRIVADVYVGGRNVATMLRAEGYAKPRAPPLSRRAPSQASGSLDIPSTRAVCDGRRRGARLCTSRQ
jgi:endonuclease YncB( thermonuclease family)